MANFSNIAMTCHFVLIAAYLISNGFAYDRMDSILDGTDRLHHSNMTRKARTTAVWDNGIIPYVINPGFTPQDEANIRIAIADYHAKTCLRWVARGGQARFASFNAQSGPGCAYTVFPDGTQMYYQDCRQINTFIHEMGHVVGFAHEHERADRDNYLEVGCLDWKSPDAEHLYDYLSAMHYACPGCPFIPLPRLPGVLYCGQSFDGGRLSVLDAEKMNDVYNCGGCLSYRFRFPQLTSPSQAFPGGQDAGRTTYICRGYINGNIYIGPASGDLRACWLGDQGVEAALGSGFELLTNPSGAPLQWRRATGVIPQGAIAGGRSAGHETAYIGRCLNLFGNVTPGRVMASNPGVVLAPYGGVEHTCTDFEILTCG